MKTTKMGLSLKNAIFANDDYENLFKAGADRIITCNTIQHISNEIDLIHLISHTLNNKLLLK